MITIVTAAIIFAGIAVLCSGRVQEKLSDALEKKPQAVFLAPLAIFCLYLFYTIGSGWPGATEALSILAFLVLPTAVLFFAQHPASSLTANDTVVVLLFWIPIDFRLLAKSWGTAAPAWPLTVLAAVILAIVLFRCFRRLEGIKLTLDIDGKDALWTLAVFGILAAVLVPSGLKVEFLQPQGFFADLESWEAVLLIIRETFTLKFLLWFLGISLTIALPEELLFRGILQNMLEKTVKKPWLALAVTAVLFGSAHLNNAARGTQFALSDPATWNWLYMGMATIAGTGYGFVFRKTRSLLCPVLLHAFVDTTWHTFFA